MDRCCLSFKGSGNFLLRGQATSLRPSALSMTAAPRHAAQRPDRSTTSNSDTMWRARHINVTFGQRPMAVGANGLCESGANTIRVAPMDIIPTSIRRTLHRSHRRLALCAHPRRCIVVWHMRWRVRGVIDRIAMWWHTVMLIIRVVLLIAGMIADANASD